MAENKTSKHIGIVACSYEGAALCYQTVCREGAELLGEHAHPEVSLHNIPLSAYMEFIYRNDWDGVAELMRETAQKLLSIGAEILICPDNTIHKVYEKAAQGLGKPWLHIAEEVLKVAEERKYRQLGILGTKYLMESAVYPEKCAVYGIHARIPAEAQRLEINRIIFEELVYGVIKPESQEYFLQIIAGLQQEGCDAVVLGCTEIPLIVLPEISPLPVLDSTRILARAALRQSVKPL